MFFSRPECTSNGYLFSGLISNFILPLASHYCIFRIAVPSFDSSNLVWRPLLAQFQPQPEDLPPLTCSKFVLLRYVQLIRLSFLPLRPIMALLLRRLCEMTAPLLYFRSHPTGTLSELPTLGDTLSQRSTLTGFLSLPNQSTSPLPLPPPRKSYLAQSIGESCEDCMTDLL